MLPVELVFSPLPYLRRNSAILGGKGSFFPGRLGPHEPFSFLEVWLHWITFVWRYKTRVRAFDAVELSRAKNQRCFSPPTYFTLSDKYSLSSTPSSPLEHSWARGSCPASFSSILRGMLERNENYLSKSGVAFPDFFSFRYGILK